MKATKIKMKAGCGTSNNLLEIDSIYLADAKEPNYYKKAAVHDYVKDNPGNIYVDISPFPKLIAVISPAPNNEKYVKSKPNATTTDNLLNLPRE